MSNNKQEKYYFFKTCYCSTFYLSLGTNNKIYLSLQNRTPLTEEEVIKCGYNLSKFHKEYA